MFEETDTGLRTFICRCSPEGRAEADALIEEVTRRLNDRAGSEVVNASNFITHIVVSLNWDYNAHVEDIYNDMWSMVSAVDDRDGVSFRVVVQCDDIEDGFAACWKAFADREDASRADVAVS